MAFVATVTLDEAPARAVADAIGDDLALGGRSIDLHEAAGGRWDVVLYFDRKPDGMEIAALARTVKTAAGANARPFTIAELPETDWVAKSLAALRPVRAGCFLVHGRHDRQHVLPNDIAIEIDAGPAFGTGHHDTTAGCLIAIDRLARRRRIVNALDLGTGTGVLAIAIAKRTKAHVVASDIDPVAVGVARDNARLNEAGRLVTAVGADGLNHRAIRASAPYDLIVANILAGPLVALAPAIARALGPGGTVILSGLLTAQARRVSATYRGHRLHCAGAIVMGEWATVMMRC